MAFGNILRVSVQSEFTIHNSLKFLVINHVDFVNLKIRDFFFFKIQCNNTELQFVLLHWIYFTYVIIVGHMRSAK